MQELERTAVKVAPTNIPILITGESGTGKEILADHIHRLSPKGSQPMAKVVCAFLNRESLSAHFNGQSNGDAQTGTLFLKEISELDPTGQRTLVYSLPQEDCSPAHNSCGPRLISSTTRNLEQEVRAGQFRADLYYQISAATLSLPPLRQRTEDIPTLVEFFLVKYFGSSGPYASALRSARFHSSAAISVAGQYSGTGKCGEKDCRS